TFNGIVTGILKPGQIWYGDKNFSSVIIPEEITVIAVSQAQPSIFNFGRNIPDKIFSCFDNNFVFRSLFNKKLYSSINYQLLKFLYLNFLLNNITSSLETIWGVLLITSRDHENSKNDDPHFSHNRYPNENSTASAFIPCASTVTDPNRSLYISLRRPTLL